MTLRTHLLAGTAVAGAGIAPSLMDGAALVLGSAAPDLVEMATPWIPHRRVAHAAVLMIPMFLVQEPTLTWFALGCMLHLVLDALTPMGVPLIPFGRHYRVMRLETGGLGDKALRLLAIAVIVGDILLATGVL